MAIEAQSDREILLLVNQQVQNMEEKFTGAIERLSDSITKLGDSLEKMETTKLQRMEDRLKLVEAWRLEIKGGYRVAIAIAASAGAGIGYLINYLLK